MKKRKKGRRFFLSALRQVPEPRTVEMEPDSLVTCMRRAEAEVLPLITNMQLRPAMAAFLLSQRTKAHMTGDPRLIPDITRLYANTVLALWQAGIYKPSQRYPYTFEETLQALLEDAEGWAEYFQPFIVTQEQALYDFGQAAEKIVRSPETYL